MEESSENLKKLFSELGEFYESDLDARKKLDRVLKNFTKEIKDGQSTVKTFSAGMLKGVERVFSAFDDLTKTAKAFDEAIEDAIKKQDLETKINLEGQKAETLKKVAVFNAGVGVQKFAVGVGGATKSILSGALDFVKGLQGTAEGTELSAKAAENAATAMIKLSESVGGLLQAIGPLMALSPLGKIWRMAGVGLTLLGFGLEKAAPALSELATQGLIILSTEIERTKKSFRDINSTGAVLGGGMTELRQQANRAGLDIAQLADVTKRSTENLSLMGMGMGENLKRFAGINKELRNSQLGIQLRKLGLTAEEQGEAAILTASILNSSGRLREMSDKQVAETTLAYAKDLKVLQGLTGEDAKKKLEEARMRSLEADILAEAMARGGPEAVNRMQSAIAATPDVLKKGFLEFVSTGGQAVVDAATNVAMANNPKIREQFQRSLEFVSSSNMTASQVMDEVSKLSETTAKYARESASSFQPIARAARLTGDALAQGSTDINNGLILLNTKIQEGATELTRINVEQAAVNMAKLDDNIAAVDEATQNLKASFSNELTPAISAYTSVLRTGHEQLEIFQDNMKAVNEFLSASGITSPAPKSLMDDLLHIGKTTATWGATGAAAGAATGLLGGPMAPATVPGGAAAGGVIGAGGGFAKGVIDVWKGEYSRGGIASGPVSGYQATLHGTEAVVPLPDNKSIPVKIQDDDNGLDKKSITSTLKDNSSSNSKDLQELALAVRYQTSVMTDMLSVMRDHKSISAGILQHSL